MSDILVIGCGSKGRSVASRLAEDGYPTFTIDWRNADLSLLLPGISEEKVRMKPDYAHEQLAAHRNEILLNMRGVSQVILLTSPGGALGSASVMMISGCAKELGIRMVSLFTVPFEFEGIRRPAVLYALPALINEVDCTFVMDLQTPISESTMFSSVMTDFDDLYLEIARMILGFMDNFPFSTTFTAKSYTFSRSVDSSVTKSFEKAVVNPLFNRDYIKDWNLVIRTDSFLSSEQMNDLHRSVADRCGQVSHIVSGAGKGPGVTVFFPLAL